MGEKTTQIESLENALFSVINPLLKTVIKKFDVECEQNGKFADKILETFSRRRRSSLRELRHSRS